MSEQPIFEELFAACHRAAEELVYISMEEEHLTYDEAYALCLRIVGLTVKYFVTNKLAALESQAAKEEK